MKLEEGDRLDLGDLVGVKVEEEVLRGESCDAGHAMLRHEGADVAANGFEIIVYPQPDSPEYG